MKTREELKDKVIEADGVVSDFVLFVNADRGALLVCEDVAAGRGTSVEVKIKWRQTSLSESAFQFDLILPAGVTFGSIRTGQALLDAQKSIQHALLNNGTAFRVLVFGLNTNEIPDGEIAIVTLNVANNAFPGFHPLDLAGFVFSGAQGTSAKGFAVSGGISIL